MYNSQKSTENLIDALPRPGQTTSLRNSDNNHYYLSSDTTMTGSNIFSKTQMPQQLYFKQFQTPAKNTNTTAHGDPPSKLSFKDSTGGVKKYETLTYTYNTDTQPFVSKNKLAESAALEGGNNIRQESWIRSQEEGSLDPRFVQNEMGSVTPGVTQSSGGTSKLQFKQPVQNTMSNTSSLSSGSSPPQGEISFRNKLKNTEPVEQHAGLSPDTKQRKQEDGVIDGGATGRLQFYRQKTDRELFEHLTQKRQQNFSSATKTPKGEIVGEGNQAPKLKNIQQSNFKATVSISGTSVNPYQNSEKKQTNSKTPITGSFHYYSYPHPNFINPFHKEYKNQGNTNATPSTHNFTNYLQYALPPNSSTQATPAISKPEAVNEKAETGIKMAPNSNNSNFSKLKQNSNSKSPGKIAVSKQRPPQKQGIKLSDFKLGKKLGKGKFGDVYIAREIKIGFVCALKIIKKKTLIEEKVDHQFIRELKIQFYLEHPKIIGLYGFFDDEVNFYMLLEYAVDGHLFGILKEKKRFTQEEAKPIVQQVCEGIEYIHTQRILHRDLKPENILIQFGLPKICDFGWAIYRADTLRDTFCGTPLYISPQILTGQKYDQSADLWAVGILTYQLLVGKIPFKIRCQEDLIKIIDEEIVFPEHVPISEVCKDFVLRMLQRDPANRYDIEQILNHPYLVQKQAGSVPESLFEV